MVWFRQWEDNGKYIEKKNSIKISLVSESRQYIQLMKKNKKKQKKKQQQKRIKDVYH